MVPNTKRRCVLGSNAHPCVLCPRSGSERSGNWRRAKGISGRIISEGTCSPHVFLTEGHSSNVYGNYSTKRTTLAMASVAYFLQQGSLLVALSQLSATRYVSHIPFASRVGPFFLTRENNM